MEFFEIDGLHYVIKHPKNFDASKKHPTLFFFHGAGTRGESVDKVTKNPFFREMEQYEDFPFMIVAPHCNEDTWFDMWERLKKMIGEVSALPYVDTARLYAMGASMGGYATWQMAMSLPDTFAAIVPICGGGMYWNAPRIKDLPVWAFHGELDSVVHAEQSKRMVDKINSVGGNARLTVYEGVLHDSWWNTYRNPEVFKWLLSHKKGEGAGEGAEKLDGADMYG